LGGHGPNSSQTFEVSALAIEGRQAGTFYGSIHWGWHSDASNTFTREPLSVISVGVPTPAFKQSTTLWNASQTSSGVSTIPMGVAAGSINPLLPSQMSDVQITARLAEIAQTLATVPAGETTQTLMFEQRALEREQRFRRIGDFPEPAKNRDTAAA
jgi:hypothetical protein